MPLENTIADSTSNRSRFLSITECRMEQRNLKKNPFVLTDADGFCLCLFMPSPMSISVFFPHN